MGYLSPAISPSHRCSYGKNKFCLNKLNMPYYDLGHNSKNFSSIINITEIAGFIMTEFGDFQLTYDIHMGKHCGVSLFAIHRITE